MKRHGGVGLVDEVDHPHRHGATAGRQLFAGRGSVRNVCLHFGPDGRQPDGTRLTGVPFEQQARQTVKISGRYRQPPGAISRPSVQITAYLKDLDDRQTFDRVMAEYVGQSLPARALVQSNLVGTDLQVSGHPRQVGRPPNPRPNSLADAAV